MVGGAIADCSDCIMHSLQSAGSAGGRAQGVRGGLGRLGRATGGRSPAPAGGSAGWGGLVALGGWWVALPRLGGGCLVGANLPTCQLFDLLGSW